MKFDKGHSSPFASFSFIVITVHVAIMANTLESDQKGRK